MKIKIYNSHSLIETNITGSIKDATYLIIASWIANQKISISNIPSCLLIDKLIKLFKSLDANINHFAVDSLIIENKLKEKKDEIILDFTSLNIIYLLLPTLLNTSKKVKVNCYNKNIINMYNSFLNTCNFSFKNDANSITFSGNCNLDYYEINTFTPNSFIFGLIFNALYLKKAATIKINFASFNIVSFNNQLDVIKRCGFDIDIKDNEIFVHNQINTLWDDIILESDNFLTFSYLTCGVLNGRCLINDVNIKNIDEYVKLIHLTGGYINIIKEDKNKKLYCANTTLLNKGVNKQPKAFEYTCFNDDIFAQALLLALFAKGTSIITYNNISYYNELLNELMSQGVNIKINDNRIVIEGLSKYQKNISLNLSNYRSIIIISIFSLLNNGCIEINNIDDVLHHYPSFYEVLISSCKKQAITMI